MVEVDGHIGHGAVLHGCRVGRNAMVGMNAVVMDKAVVGAESIVGAASFVKAGMVIPPRSLVLGAPAKVIREVSRRRDRMEELWHAAVPRPGGALDEELARSRCAREVEPGRGRDRVR